ncbi:leucine-rich repeat-containing G-protein coupled receptor 6 isoform X1 [Diabrotica virgifera virgifera]|uniref:Leucine-rich repeat-containing protein 15-like n=1 Tax=Diabrotica virgifera virgifera TaxID=50390 RepID=A0ABM5L5Z1_DIAVI|nr:leucine-rich repeat-containing G-protein coupled receptor 6 isoform X1 [Diabrotica virgifera virgifera]
MILFSRWPIFIGAVFFVSNIKICNTQFYGYNPDDTDTGSDIDDTDYGYDPYASDNGYDQYDEHNDDIIADHRREQLTSCQYARIHLPTSFNDCTKVEIIDSNISDVTPAAFLNVYSTTNLKLSGNFIKTIKPGAFSGLHNLEQLDLHNNQIVNISQGIFNHLVQLKSLDLSRNKISNIDPNFLTGVIHLSSLNFSENYLKSFDGVVLGQNNYFKILNLIDNSMSFINLSKFNGEINTLDVSSNKLTFVDVCLSGLQNLNASNNQIKYLHADSCLLDATLITLDVSNNLLNEQNLMNVSKLLKLEKLNIAGNNLSFIPVNLFVNLTRLSYLNMSHNKISFLNYGALDHLNVLQSLDLSYNNLTTLKRYFHSLSALTSLYINSNKITNINSKQLLNDIRGLNIINIDSNDFNCGNLVEVIHDFKNKVFKGTVTIGSNIHGIACKEGTLQEANPDIKFKEEIIKYLEKTISAKLEKSESLQFNKSLMYDNFNKYFKNSNFYKYLEGLKNINTLNFNGTDMLKYFNQDFKNSFFYKYLESLKANENSTREFNRSLYDYFNNDFNGTYLVKYLTKLERSKGEFIDSFDNSSMFNYFNKGFKNSTFYKYLENLNSKFDNIQQKDHGTAEYLHSSSEQQGHSYFATQSVIIMLLIILVLFKVVKIYSNYNSKNLIPREQVELLDTNSIA